MAQQLSVTKQYFQYIAKLIDDEPALSHEREIRILRAQTEQCCQSVIQLVGKALGARPYCEEPTFSQLIADLPVFIRQSHAAFDYESIAELCLPEKKLMGTLKHPLVEDRMISGEGTPNSCGLRHLKRIL